MKSAPKKHGKPPHIPGGGTMANISFHGTWVRGRGRGRVRIRVRVGVGV